MKDEKNPQSKVMILIPSINGPTSTSRDLVLFDREGFITHEGILIDFKTTWKYMANYINHMLSLSKELVRKEIVRSSFYGIKSLKYFMGHTDCSFIRFAFGINEERGSLSQNFEPILIALNEELKSMNIYMDLSAPCPPTCPDTPICTMTDSVSHVFNLQESNNILDDIRNFRDEWLVKNNHSDLFEEYYHTMPVISNNIRKVESNIDSIFKTMYYKR